MERTRTLLESCFKELLNKVTINRLKTINFPATVALVIPEAPSSNITKTPQPKRILSAIYLGNNDEVIVTCITTAIKPRSKAKISEYSIRQFDEDTMIRLLNLGIQYLNAY